MTDGVDDRFIAQELRSALDRREDLDDLGAYIEHDDLRDLLVRLSAGWSTYSSDSSPDRFEDTELCRTLLRMYGNRRLLDLLDSENNVGLSFLLGAEDSTATFDSNFPALDVLSDIHNDGAPYILSVFGAPKVGKTAAVASYIRWTEKRYGERETTVISNIESLERTDEFFDSPSTLDRAVSECDTSVLVFDECHEHLDGGRQESRQFVRDTYAPFLKKCGKRGVVAVYHIAHTGKDLHPEVKRLSTHLGKKVDRKTLRLYHDFDDNSHRLVNEHRVLEDLPAPPYYYNPNDMAPFRY